jgi:hypothetical protein
VLDGILAGNLANLVECSSCSSARWPFGHATSLLLDAARVIRTQFSTRTTIWRRHMVKDIEFCGGRVLEAIPKAALPHCGASLCWRGYMKTRSQATAVADT